MKDIAPHCIKSASKVNYFGQPTHSGHCVAVSRIMRRPYSYIRVHDLKTIDFEENKCRTRILNMPPKCIDLTHATASRAVRSKTERRFERTFFYAFRRGNSMKTVKFCERESAFVNAFANLPDLNLQI